MTDKDQYKSKKSRLVGKVERFLSCNRSDRRAVRRFIDDVQDVGRIHIIGGLLRELLVCGNRGFSSDVDLVIDGVSQQEFTRWISKFEVKRNRFGGYAVKLERAKVDIWHLEQTWARREASCTVETPEDLCRTTFFDWDSILYSVKDRKIVTDDCYFDRVNSRILDVNLPDNPSPFGNAVRALRYSCRYNARFGRRLSSHVLRQIVDHGWDALVLQEQATFRSCYIKSLRPETVVERLQAHEWNGEEGPVAIFESSAQLPLQYVATS